MSRKHSPRRRFRVVARAVDRTRRAKTAAVALALVLLGALAAASARHSAAVLSRMRLSLPVVSSAESALVDGISEPFRSRAQAVVDAAPGSAGEKAEALRAKFPCVADVSIRRSWGEKRATLVPVLRRAVAAALRRGKPTGYLGADGSVFAAPAGVFDFSGPSVDVAGASEKDLEALVREWPALSHTGSFPSPLALLAYRSPEDGWQARLMDGTTILWGRLDWTKEKLSRLSEALNDAHAKAPGVFAADLRFFEDGKVLLKPVGPSVAAGVRGGVR